MNAADIVKRFDALDSARNTVKQVWDLIEKFIMPIRGGKFFEKQDSEHEIDWRRGRDVFDNTAILAANILAASMHGALTNPATQWFDLAFRQKALSDDVEAKRWLETCSDALSQAIQDSNFNLEVNETYLDLVGFGHSAICEEESDQSETGADLEFGNIPIRECFFEQDFRGRPKNFYRLYQWSPVQIISKFGINSVPQDIKDKAANAGSLDTKEDVIFCIYRRDHTPPLSLIHSPNMRQYGYQYVLKRTAQPLGVEGGYYEMPVYMVRWLKASGSMWGYGPGTMALSDVMTLNHLIELILKATEKVVDPANLATERAVLGDLDLGAGGLTIVRNMEGLKPYESAARFDVSSLQVEDLRSKINRTFLVDQLQMKDSPTMTATEVQVRYELMQRLLGPTLGRLQSDLLDPLIQRSFNILMRKGVLPKPPDMVMAAGGAMDVEYVGPLSRAQKMDRVMAAERWVMTLGNLSKAMPSVMDIPDPDGIARELGRMLGVPSSMVRSAQKTVQVRKERESQQKAMFDAAQAEQMAKAAQAGSGAVANLEKAGEQPTG